MALCSLPKVFGVLIFLVVAVFTAFLASFVSVTNSVVLELARSASSHALQQGVEAIGGRMLSLEGKVRMTYNLILDLNLQANNPVYNNNNYSLAHHFDPFFIQALGFLSEFSELAFVYQSYATTNGSMWTETGCGRDSTQPTGLYCYVGNPKNAQYYSIAGQVPINISTMGGLSLYDASQYPYSLQIRAMNRQENENVGLWLSATPFEVDVYVTFSMPLAFDRRGNCVTAVSMDLNIVWIREMLMNVTTAAAGYTYLIDARRGLLIASTLPFPALDADGNPWNATNTPNQRVNDEVRSRSSGTGKLPFEAGVRISVNDDADEFVSTVHIQQGTLHWVLFQHTPQSYYLGRPRTLQAVFITLTCLIVVALIVSKVTVWRSIAAAVSRLTERMEAASLLDDNEPEDPPSALDEINSLFSAYYQLRGKLNELRSFVPKAQLLTAAEVNDTDDNCPSSRATSPEERSIPAISSFHHGSERSGHSNGHSASPKNHYEVGKSTRSTAPTESDSSSVGIVRAVTGLTERFVSVLMINVKGFHLRLSSEVDDNFMSLHGRLVDLVETAVGAQKGIVEFFHGDRFFCTFNASRPAFSSGKRAALAALSVTAQARKLDHEVLLSCGIASGKGMVGVMGSDTMKRFCTVGHCVTYAAALEREGALRDGSVTILASESTIPDIEHEIYYQVVGVAQPCRSVGLRRPQKVVAIAGVKAAKEDEWMYTLNEGESKDPFSKLNVAFDAFLRGDVNSARRVIDHLENPLASDSDRASGTARESIAVKEEITSQGFTSLRRALELGLPNLTLATPKLNII